MKRLSELTDVIYVHVDMDGLEPKDVPGVSLPVPNGPTSVELAAALTEMLKYEKVAAFGVAAMPFDDHDTNGISQQAACNLILGAVERRTGPREAMIAQVLLGLVGQKCVPSHLPLSEPDERRRSSIT